MTTVFEYSQKNILVIPQSLHYMSDVDVLIENGHSGIFYKNLDRDLKDVEFYTNFPCVIYIKSGREFITTSDDITHELKAQTAIFLPQGIHLHSDYVKLTENLKAYLVFFTTDLFSIFIGAVGTVKSIKTKRSSLVKVQCDSLLEEYFQSIHQMQKNHCMAAALVNIKLLELLHLLYFYDKRILNAVQQSGEQTQIPKRNLARLLSSNDVLKLGVTDLANLSGRSISTFSRDFKALYGVPPKRWLQNRRLDRAGELLQTGDFTVTQIAADLGYENVSHFIKAFKEKYEMTPNKYKQTVDG